MKRFLLSLLLLLPFVVGAQSLRGDWSGKLSLPMGKLRMVIHLTEEAGRWSATLDSPDQGAYALRADEVHVSGDSLRMELRSLRLTYTAVRTQDDKLSGNFQQGGMSLPLDMGRSAEKQDAPQAPASYTEEELSIPVSGSSVVLSGSLALPKTGQASYPTLVLITGSGPQDRDETIFGCKPFLDITRRLTEAGFAVFRYDDRGVGKSTGVFLASSITDFVHDAEAVVAALRGNKSVKAQRIFLVGHSEGSYIAAKVASQDRSIAGVVSLAGPAFGMDRVVLDQMDALNLLAGKSESERATLSKANLEIYRLMQDKRLSLDEVKARAAKVIRATPPRLQPRQEHPRGDSHADHEPTHILPSPAPQLRYCRDVACREVSRHRALRRDGQAGLTHQCSGTDASPAQGSGAGLPEAQSPLPAFLYGFAYGISYAQRALLRQRPRLLSPFSHRFEVASAYTSQIIDGLSASPLLRGMWGTQPTLYLYLFTR